MGYDTYLLADDEMIRSWRKHASVLPRLLFHHDDVEIGLDHEGNPLVEYRSTAAKVRDNLNELGLGWAAAVRNYSAIRIARGGASGLYIGRKLSDGIDPDEVEQALHRFASLPPEHDLMALSALIATAVSDGSDALEQLELLDLDNVVDHLSPTRVCFAHFNYSESKGLQDGFAAARAAESLASFHTDAPMLSWLIVAAALVEGLGDGVEIVLDLSEDARETIDDYSDLQEYVDAYWSSSTGALVTHAELMGRMYAGLGEIERRVGREYWVSRVAQFIAMSDASPAHSPAEKGKFLEDLVEMLVSAEGSELTVLEKNMRLEGAELDLVLKNRLRDTFWSSLNSPLFVVECKNWSVPVGVDTLRSLESKVDDYGDTCRIGILVSVSGFTGPVRQRLKSRTGEGRIIFLIELDDLRSMSASGSTLSEWLGSEGIRRVLKGSN